MGITLPLACRCDGAHMRPAVRCLFVAAFLVPGSIWAQEVATRPRAGRETGLPEPPLVVARPDFAVQDGAVSVGSFGKLAAARQFDFATGLHSSFEGSVSLAAPGERTAEPGLRKGFVRWQLRNRRGTQGEIGFLADPIVQTLRSSLESPFAGSVHLSIAAESRWARQAWGVERVGYGRIGFRRGLPAGLVVHSAVHVIDVAPAAVRWFGTSHRVERRGAEFGLHHEWGRSRSWSLRQTWRRSNSSATLGGQILERRDACDRSLAQIGVGKGGYGLQWFPARDQQAILLIAGPVQVGYGQRAARRQLVLGVRSLSISCFESPQGPEFGFGFVFGGWVRHLVRPSEAWRWALPVQAGALAEPHLRWPGFATRLE